MRLIDADGLLLIFAEYQLQESPNWGANGYGSVEAYEAITECMKAVEEQPTIKPEQKRGKWVEHKDYPGLAYLCSECNHFTTIRSFFCPNCGAKMEAER